MTRLTPRPAAALTRRGVLGAGAAGLALAACGQDEAAPAGSAPAGASATPSEEDAAVAPLEGGREVTVRTCVYANNHASSMLFWQQFAPEGVTVEVTPVTNTADIIAGLEGGTLDFGLMSPYVPMLTQPTGGITSKVVAMVARQGFGLVGRAGVVESVEDLAGKKIAVPPPGAQVLVLDLLLEEAGLVLGTDVEGVPLGYADHVAALASGQVDAFMGSEPPCSQAVVDGTGVRLEGVYDTALGDLNTALWASSAILEDPEVVTLVTQLQKRAAEFMTPGGENDPEVWRSLLVDSFGFDEAVYEEVLGTVGAQWQFDETRESQFEAVGKALVETGELPAEPDYEALYAREYWDV
ncbi:ABC transporter substrate-binding protein [Aquipuribacter hungaricus]|uniref:ABC transporter substrate-binding protein n=1 Tax=Aquipuribacter hungaricus TaxID=545624 RepID=A0ABV7WJF5_9MICO